MYEYDLIYILANDTGAPRCYALCNAVCHKFHPELHACVFLHVVILKVHFQFFSLPAPESVEPADHAPSPEGILYL